MGLEDRIEKLEADFGITKKKIPPFEFTEEDKEILHLKEIIDYLRTVKSILTSEEWKALIPLWNKGRDVMVKPFKYMDKYGPDNWRKIEDGRYKTDPKFRKEIDEYVAKEEEKKRRRESLFIDEEFLFSDYSIMVWERYTPERVKPLLRNRTEIVKRLLAKKND
jgi:hypothetical protein